MYSTTISARGTPFTPTGLGLTKAEKAARKADKAIAAANAAVARAASLVPEPPGVVGAYEDAGEERSALSVWLPRVAIGVAVVGGVWLFMRYRKNKKGR